MRPILVSVSESLPGCQNIVFSLLFYLTLVTGSFDKAKLQKVTTKVVWAVPGRDVELPCDVTPPVPSDAVNMVFWFKDSNGMPLYSLDARGGPLNESSHLAMSDDLGKRSYFITEQNPARARLKIHQVHTTDEGVFRCRVDFINSPTRNFKVNLTLVVQPSPPKVFDAEGREIISEAGPFLEGDELFLSCQTNGGIPRPSLIWWNNGTILDSVVDTSREAFTTVNQLLISKVSRTLRGSTLECRATSLEIAGDIIREVPIIVYLKPNKVKIVSPNELLSSAKVQTVRCETSGSYPPAKISWSLEGKPIRNALLTEEETENFSSSILSLRFEAEDDGKDLICRADNPRFPGGYLEDRRQIHVAYPPKVAVRLDSTGTASTVKEGTMVVLRCECVSRPNPHTYSWYHNGHLVPFNETGGIYPMDNTLTIKQIHKSSEGEYSCSATNTEGETYSSPFNLVVQYAPRCKKGYEVQRVGAIAYENMMVQCHVDAIPEVTRFHWTYNTSKGVLPIQGGKMQNKNGVSVLHFSTGTMDVESLSCWATNGVGRQEAPCLFYIVPADKPESPRNCNIRNATHGGLEVSCLPGRDGGLQQSFVLEVEDLSLPLDSSGITTLSDQGEHATPLYRVLGEMPIFRLHSLQPGRQYQFLVYAENARGRSSPPVQLSNIRVDVPVDSLQENGLSVGVLETDRDRNRDSEATRRETGITESSLNLTLLLVILAATAMVLIVGIISVASVLACRRQPTVVLRNRRSSKPPDELELSEAGFNEGFHRRSAQYRASLYVTDVDCDRIPPSSRTINSGVIPRRHCQTAEMHRTSSTMAASNITGPTRMEMLNGDNYDTRRIQVQAILVKNDARPYVSGKKVKPEVAGKGIALVQSQAAYNWELADSKARVNIILTMCPTQLKHLRNGEISREVWEKLESVYSCQGPARKQTLLEHLMSQKLHEGDNFRDYLSQFMDLVSKLESMDITINGDFLTMMLLRSLPESYDNFRCAIKSRDSEIWQR